MTSLFRQEVLWGGVLNPITDDQVKQWVRNLRSGQYEQGQHRLCDGNAYCCLGVLADQLKLFEDKTFLHSDTELATPPVNGAWGAHQYYQLPSQIQDTLAELNDHGTTFSEIADIIEEGFFGEYTDHNNYSAVLRDNNFDYNWLSYAEIVADACDND